MLLFYFCSFKVAPYFTLPQSPTTHQFLFNVTTSISCTFSARPLLDNSAVTWYKDGGQVEMGQSYSVVGRKVAVPERYRWTEGWRSELVITPISGDTCDHVTKFDGVYTCQVADGIRSDTSQGQSIKAQCEHFS